MIGVGVDDRKPFQGFLSTRYHLYRSSSGTRSSGDWRQFTAAKFHRKGPFPSYIAVISEEMMIATIDNPSNAVEWAIAEMLKQPESLRRAVEEIDNVVGKDRLVQESDFPKLNYVKACAREAFRLHPTTAFTPPHMSMDDTVVSKYLIPKGSHVFLCRRELGRIPKHWDEPNKFKPERHLKRDDSNVVLTEPDLKFISFSTGRRGCPGVMLGTSMTVMLFARLLHSFTWSLPDNCNDDLCLVKPLVVIAKPRLPANVYLTIVH